VNKIFAHIALFLFASGAQAQSTNHHVLGNAVNDFYYALSSSSDSNRNQLLETLFIEGGQVVSLSYEGDGASRVAEGSLARFLEAGQLFYSQYTVHYEELDRETEAYADLAVVHSAVLQRSTDRSSGASYEQRLWFSLDLVYTENGWRIAYAGWTSERQEGDLRMNPRMEDYWRKP
jgi:hypothetical protein